MLPTHPRLLICCTPIPITFQLFTWPLVDSAPAAPCLETGNPPNRSCCCLPSLAFLGASGGSSVACTTHQGRCRLRSQSELGHLTCVWEGRYLSPYQPAVWFSAAKEAQELHECTQETAAFQRKWRPCCLSREDTILLSLPPAGPLFRTGT